MPDLLTLTGRDGAQLHLLAVTTLPDGLEAEGYIADTPLRGGRVLTDPDGQRYRLSAGLKPGITWEHPLELTRRN